ncbi:MAG TPA: hypothetical protein VHO24_17300 [Opitutaceae bacterium]|nr:hypothetical protein [Opitutaceae bacterium]
MNKLRGFTVILALAATSFPAVAQLSGISSRAAFPTTDSVNWSLLGPPFITANNPFVIATTGGSSVWVSHAPGALFERRNQTTGGWIGNFAFGEALLWNRGDNGSITFDPANLISGAGFNVQADVHGAFTFQLDAYDTTGGLIGSVTRSGMSDINLGTAIFIGFTSAYLDVDKFVGTLTSSVGGGSNFAINSLALSSSAPVAPVGAEAVPEPSVYGLMGVLVILGLVGRERLRRHSHV